MVLLPATIACVIVDAHTHIFSPGVRDAREDYVQRDPLFGALYSRKKAKIATAEDLLRSMDRAGIDASVAMGFAWDDAELCVQHNDYLLEAAAKSGGRIIPFCTVNPFADEEAREAERCARAGACGLGELRPDSQGWNPHHHGGEALAAVAERYKLVLAFHVSEPVGHDYPGKEGGGLGVFYHFAREHPKLRIIGAHLAGGLPFYATMPEVREVFSHVRVDTAAQPLLYTPVAFEHILPLISAERILFGSDYPLIAQSRAVEDLRSGVFGSDDLAAILGGNARRLLGLGEPVKTG